MIVADDLRWPERHRRVPRLHADVRSWTGNDLQLVEHSPAAGATRAQQETSVVEQIRLDGIALAGHTAALLGHRR